MTPITDKVQVKNGADFTFICKKVPFAISCSSQLPHLDYNLIDLDLVNKMKIPLQRIKVSRYTIMGETVRSVGFISQTIQCVRDGKISGNIHIQAKVIRDLYTIFDVDCVASSRTYTRLVGKPPKPPDDTKVPNLDDIDNVDDEVIEEDDEKPACDAERDIDPPSEEIEKQKEVLDATASHDAVVEAKKDAKHKYNDEYLEYLSSLQVCQPPPMTLKEWRKIPQFGQIRNVSVYETSPGACISDGDDDSDEDDDDDINDDPQAQNQYQSESSGYGYRDPDPGETFCNFCFVSGQPVRVAHSHNILEVTCPSMSHVDKERIHGPNWLAKMHGYND